MNKLVEFICPTCDKQLIWAKESAKVLCNSCSDWVEFNDLKNPRIIIEEVDEPTQLTIF
ncbi:hypothetical protein [Dendrosporobacter sp. 1207_IL3150]|uniref:hypothetical protein n=1 Tax=Dendrosporobacter sp. 1207_IL3150 TaxID=3084054 RepID=UPI002FD8FEAE